MENNYQGKYFSFFNIYSNQLQIIKFKKKEDDFYAANTIWESRIIPNILFELNTDNTIISQKELMPFPDKIEILFLDNFYHTGEKINFVVLNKEFDSFFFSFIVMDKLKNICFYDEKEFLKTDPYRSFEFSLKHPGCYIVKFYINNIYEFCSYLRIKENSLSKYSIEIQEVKNKLSFKLIPDDYNDPINIKYWNLNNYNENYDSIQAKEEESLEELYVPLSVLFKTKIKENDFQKFLKIKLENKYNAMGIMKIIDTLKIMDKKEEVKFMENVFQNDSALALTIMEISFDFDILFLISEDESREILNLADDSVLVAALKGETKDRIEQIKKCLPEKRWEKVSALFDRIETIEMDKTDDAQKKIGTVIRSYYQKKYGIPFAFEKKEKSRLKIRNFEVNKNDEILLPDFRYNGYYMIEFILKKQSTFNIIHKVTGKEQEYKFYRKTVFSTEDFFEIVNIDEKYIYLKFNKKVKQCSAIINSTEDTRFYEFSRIYSDEIIRLTKPGKNTFRMIIGTINHDKENPVNEADIIINLYKMEENKIFIPDHLMTYEKIPMKILNDKNALFYIRQRNIPVSIIENKFKDLIEIEKKEKLELSSQYPNDIIVMEIKDMDLVPNHVHNNFNSLTLFYSDNEELNLQNSGIYSLSPLIVRMIHTALYFYNFMETPLTLNIFQDNENIFTGTFQQKYYEFRDLDKTKKIKVHVESSAGEYIYHFIPPVFPEKIDLKNKYELKGENPDKILSFIQQFPERNIIYLIAELKIYHFKYRNTGQKIYSTLIGIILKKLKNKYYKNKYFIYDPASEFNRLDIIDILLHLQEIYKAGFNQLDRMIEEAFLYLKKIKLKNKRLKDYTRPEKFKFF